MKPANKATLTKILTYHVVAGKVKASDLISAIGKHGGRYSFDTVAGQELTARLVQGKVVITDAMGGRSIVTQTDVRTSNGVIHVTDGVFMPN